MSKRMTDLRLDQISGLVDRFPKTINGDYLRELLQALKAERKDRNEWAMAAKAEADEVDARGRRIREMRGHIKTAMALLPDRPAIALETLNKALEDD